MLIAGNDTQQIHGPLVSQGDNLLEGAHMIPSITQTQLMMIINAAGKDQGTIGEQQ